MLTAVTSMVVIVDALPLAVVLVRWAGLDRVFGLDFTLSDLPGFGFGFAVALPCVAVAFPLVLCLTAAAFSCAGVPCAVCEWPWLEDPAGVVVEWPGACVELPRVPDLPCVPDPPCVAGLPWTPELPCVPE